ncbi:MAG: oxygenase MpaB family protein [Chloroflexota bacterium]
MPKQHISERIAALDPSNDHQEIVRLLTFYVFPWDFERALEFALFRTYAVPSISKLLAETKEFLERPRKRYDDTELIMYEIAEHGYDSDRGRRALRRMNQMHGRFDISNDDFLYVLTTFIFEPMRWVEELGKRPLTDNEKQASLQYYLEVGRRMNIQNIPTDLETLEQFNRQYEAEHFHYSESNRKIGNSTVNLFLGFYLPKLLWPLGRPVVYAMMDGPLRDAFGYPHPPAWLRPLVVRLLGWRAAIIRRLPERRKPVFGTQRKRPTYPEGYKIEELGTFR